MKKVLGVIFIAIPVLSIAYYFHGVVGVIALTIALGKVVLFLGMFLLFLYGISLLVD